MLSYIINLLSVTRMFWIFSWKLFASLILHACSLSWILRLHTFFVFALKSQIQSEIKFQELIVLYWSSRQILFRRPSNCTIHPKGFRRFFYHNSYYPSVVLRTNKIFNMVLVKKCSQRIRHGMYIPQPIQCSIFQPLWPIHLEQMELILFSCHKQLLIKQTSTESIAYGVDQTSMQKVTQRLLGVWFASLNLKEAQVFLISKLRMKRFF